MDNVILTSWIPESLAKKDRIVRLKVDDVWIDGWLIQEVYDAQKESSETIEDSQDYKHQREASDI